jgi:hypothetical protein
LQKLSTGTLGEKKANVKPLLFLRLAFTVPFRATSGNDIQAWMENFPKRSASVTVAAVVAILSSLFLLLCCAFTFLAILLVKLPGAASEVPPSLRIILLGTQGFAMCLCLFGTATGIGLIYLRNWARISILIGGGFSVFFGLVGIPITYFSLSSPMPNTPQLPAESMYLVRVILLFIYGLPLLIGVWWCVLFNRKSVKAQFAGAKLIANSDLPRKPACPLPVAVLAWFYIASILNLLFLPFIPFRVPVFVFGQVLPRGVGLAVLTVSCLALALAGVGLLKLKPWSYSLTMGLQLFWLSSTVVSVLSPNYKTWMDSFSREMEASLHLPATTFPQANFTHNYGWTVVLGLLFAGAILGLLVYYRPRFLEAASRAASYSPQV